MTLKIDFFTYNFYQTKQISYYRDVQLKYIIQEIDTIDLEKFTHSHYPADVYLYCKKLEKAT